ncbi:MAG: helix-turn-helix domain-containing protein [Acidobacteriota bacterium]
MSRKRFDAMNCSVARSLDQVGDWWSLLIVRDAMLGVRRFADFEANLGIAKNILSDRLKRLTEDEILERRGEGRRVDYVLTRKGRELGPVLEALRLWGDRWVFGAGNEPLVAQERGGGARVARLLRADAEGNVLDSRNLEMAPGPGADEATLEAFFADD